MRLQDAKLQQLLVDYKNTVLTAQQQADDGTSAILQSWVQVGYMRNSADAARGALRIGMEQYEQAATAMSGVVGLSKRHFLRAFKAATGTTPHRFVLRMRIEEAKRRLIETNEAMTEVALASGFDSSQQFATSFRSATGITPSTFRLRHSA